MSAQTHVKVRRMLPDGRLEPVEAGRMAEPAPVQGAIHWVDIAGASRADLRARLIAVGLAESFAGQVTDPAARFDLIIEEQAVCFNLTAPAAWWQDFDRAAVHVVALEGKLVTAHVDPFPELGKALEHMTHLDPRLPRTTFGLVIALLRIFFLADGNFYHGLRRQAGRMEAILDGSVADFRLEELIASERAASRVSETWLDNEATIKRLTGVALRPLDVTALAGSIGLLGEAARVFRQSLAELEKRLDKNHRHYESVMQAMTERRLRFLTVISAVFLPLGLIAGIYGMNFPNMPELQSRYGFEIVVGVMIILGLGAVIYFRRRGWFR